MFYKLLQFFAAPLIRFFWVGKINNINNIPKNGAVILCANHNSYLDFFILSSLNKRRVYFLAGEVFFKSKLWRPLMLLTGQVRVDRTSKDKSFVYNQVNKILKDNNILGIFPEGTRSRDGELHRGYNGAVKFSYKYNVPIIPIGIIGSFDAWSPHNKKPKLKKCDINIGDSFKVASENFDVETKVLMKKIALLANKKYEE